MLTLIKQNLKVWHMIVAAVSIIIITALTVILLFLFTPKYVTYVAKENMKREVLWSETHAKMALEIGPNLQKYPEYIPYLEAK